MIWMPGLFPFKNLLTPMMVPASQHSSPCSVATAHNCRVLVDKAEDDTGVTKLQ